MSSEIRAQAVLPVEKLLPLDSRFAGSNPAEAMVFKGDENPQHAFLRRGSKTVGPLSFDFTAC
jgi:hypothetical protein